MSNYDYLAKRRDGKCQKGTQRKGASVNRERAILSGIFTRAIKRGVHPGPNPCRDVERYEEAGRPERVVSREEEKKYLDSLRPDDEVLGQIVEIALGTGLRREELFRLRAEHLFFDRGKTGYVQVIQPNAKAKKARWTPMLFNSREVLFKLKGSKTEGRLLSLGANSTGQRIARRFKKIGLAGITLHTMRHTFATRCLEAGVHPFVYQQWLGHSTLSQTKYYSHVGFEEMEHAVQKLEEAIAPTA